MTAGKTIKVAGASGFWGESDMAVPQFLKESGIDYIVFDYLAEITMSIMARARAKDEKLGYAPDFVSVALKPNLAEIAKQGVKIISNAGGVNPKACAKAVEAAVQEAGLSLKVALVEGDDLIAMAGELAEDGTTEMFTGDGFPTKDTIASINAYLGAFPIAAALDAGADIVITGRCVDSAVTLGACIHEFGWKHDDVDVLAGGCLAGHIIECGPQATGGNFTDWEDVADGLHDVGYPIAEIGADGRCVISKPAGTGGAVTIGTVCEQMLYEIGDPQAYILPDVICDFSEVTLIQAGANKVKVEGAKGFPAPSTYKVSTTYSDGWRIGFVWFFVGRDAANKAKSFAHAALNRARAKLRSMNAADYTETLVETVGDNAHFGPSAENPLAHEVAVKIAVRHEDARGAGLLLREATGLALAAPPGLAPFAASRPKPSPVVRLFSHVIDKSKVKISVSCDGKAVPFTAQTGAPFDEVLIERPAEPAVVDSDEPLISVPLISLAYGRSGDKGNKANIGLLPRDRRFAGWIWQALSCQRVADAFAHFLEVPDASQVHKYYLPGTASINFVLNDVLGGGGMASLRNDPQGKSFAQILLQQQIAIPASIVMDETA